MKTTLNQLNRELQAIQVAHGQLNSYFWGGLDRAVHDNTLTYPLMCCYNASNGGGMQERLTGVSLVIVIADKVFKDYSSLDDTQSDTLKVCREVFNVLNKSTRWRKILTIRSASCTNFVDGKDDEITGHILTLTVDLKDTQSYCDIPMFDYDFDDSSEGLSCAGGVVRILNSDGDLLETIEVDSGDIEDAIAPDASYTVQYINGTLIEQGTIPSGGSVTVDVPNPIICQDATWELRDSDGVLLDSGTVASGGSVTITAPDASAVLKNTEGTTLSTTTIPSDGSEDIIAPNATFSINSVVVATIPSGSSDSIQVRQAQGATQIGSLQGQYWRVPNSPITVDSSAFTSLPATDGLDLQVVDQNNNTVPTLLNSPQIKIVQASSAPVMKTGQTTSFADFDDGFYEAGRDVGFFTLERVPFNIDGTPTINTTTNRFTDTLGGQVYVNNIMLDWSTHNVFTGGLLAYSLEAICSKNFLTHLTDSTAYSLGGFATWRQINRKELQNLYNDEIVNPLNWSPFNNNANFSANISTNTTRKADTTQVWYTLSGQGREFGIAKTTALQSIYVRTINTSEL